MENSARMCTDTKGTASYVCGVHCPIEIIMKRRIETWKVGYSEDGSIPLPVKLWQESVHELGIYDLEIDTSVLTPEECANLIRLRLENGPPRQHFN